MQTILFSLKALTVAGILGVILSFSSEAQAQDVTVELISGESYTASIDGRTDADYLWLSFEGVGSTLLRPVAWESIAAHSLAAPLGAARASLASHFARPCPSGKPPEGG